MKKRAVMAAMVAALVLSQATTAFAAGSTSSGGSGRATVSATYADEVSITLNGNTTTPNYGGEASNGATSVAWAPQQRCMVDVTCVLLHSMICVSSGQ